MDPRHDSHSGQGRLAGPWTPQPVGPAPAHVESDTADAVVTVGGWIVAGVAIVVVAATALLVAAAIHAIATWRRWRWWPLALTGLVGLLVVVAVFGPAGMVDRHLLALRELTDSRAVGERWPSWLVAQVPLSLPLGLLLAAFARHQVTHIAAHELSPRARARRDAEDRAQLAAAIRRSSTAPDEIKDQPVLGAWITGDLFALAKRGVVRGARRRPRSRHPPRRPPRRRQNRVSAQAGSAGFGKTSTRSWTGQDGRGPGLRAHPWMLIRARCSTAFANLAVG
jgi:hypothetical protein